ncbi:hypothetical protein [Brevibacterium oceani]|uniref:hypothetical protein n=1 Tax=Brevibacterium oceani TaxID=358099 RepID=UPI001B3207EF|nr:hypothetical protein [Brevibacterium oceani]
MNSDNNPVTSPRPKSASEGPSTDVRLKDIAPRLGCQAHTVPTPIKVELIDRLSAAGIQAIEATSFVRPDLVPGLADAEQVMQRVDRSYGTQWHCCVGNERGLRRAIDAGVDYAWFLLSADEGFSRANTGMTTAESIEQLAKLRRIAAGSGVTIGTYLIFAWGGPSGPPRGPELINNMAPMLSDAGVSEWILADSSGYASPLQMTQLITAAFEHNVADRITVQVHDGRGMGVANAVELARLGIANIDVSLGGSGGHPAMPNYPGGGTCSEDVVLILERMGVRTGIDLSSLIETSRWWADEVGVPSPGFSRRIGPVPNASNERPSADFTWQSPASVGKAG